MNIPIPPPTVTPIITPQTTLLEISDDDEKNYTGFLRCLHDFLPRELCEKNDSISPVTSIYTDENLGKSILILDGEIIFEDSNMALLDYKEYLNNARKIDHNIKNNWTFVKGGRCLNRGLLAIFVSDSFGSTGNFSCGKYNFKIEKCSTNIIPTNKYSCKNAMQYSSYCDKIVDGTCQSNFLEDLRNNRPFLRYLYDRDIGVTEISLVDSNGNTIANYYFSEGSPIK